MTNAEKYLKDGVSAEEFAQKLHTSMCLSPESYFSYKSVIITFLKEQAKPTLTEDERVILRNIQLYTGNPVTIRRIGDGHLYISGGCGFIDFGEYNHLFQFIKERRRI